MKHAAFAASLLAAALAWSAPAQAQSATAELKDTDGKEVGTLQLSESGDGVRISGELTGLSPGEHAFHIHETGECEPPFKSAGGHFNPTDAKHGKVEGGPHAGDMDNITVGEDGSVSIDVVNEMVTLKEGEQTSVHDDDGSAIVVHAGADDYESQPSGDAGDRVACGVIR